ncbi:MAG: endonuclease III [Anaerolineales bacterium]
MITSESPPTARLPEIIARLRAAHPDARCALDFETPFQLLVATMLSAQCTDERVNMVTPALFEQYPNPEALAAAERAELEESIRPTGFFRRKAQHLQAASRLLALEHGGEVPARMEALTALPGVARKTANVVLGVAYGVAEGVVVDTHVKRLAHRLGLTAHTDPVKVERDLMALTPRAEWIDLSHLLIFHGRRVCDARKPDCAHCTLSDLCPSSLV